MLPLGRSVLVGGGGGSEARGWQGENREDRTSGKAAPSLPTSRIEGSQEDFNKEDQEKIAENLISEEMQ